MNPFARAVGSSAVVSTAGRFAKESIVFSVAVTLFCWPRTSQRLGQVRRRIAIGARGEWSPRQEARDVALVDGLLSRSVVVRALRALVTPSIAASHDSSARRTLGSMVDRDLAATVQTGGVAFIVAVLSHTTLLALLGVSVHALGWGIRTVLLVAGLAALQWPTTLAAAWDDKLTRSK